MFPVWLRDDLLGTKDRIYALQIDGIPKAYPRGSPNRRKWSLMMSWVGLHWS